MPGAELGIAVTAAVALGAGLIRGFTGFGGPAFMLAILTIFYPPLMILGKVLVVDIIASSFLFYSCYPRINWRQTLWIAVPTMLLMPLGQWLLIITDAELLRRLIALTILLCSLLMLSGLRYRQQPGRVALALVGIVAGIVFGASYIALVAVLAILMGPFDRHEARTLIVSWAFLVSVWYAVISIVSGTTDLQDLQIALPGAVLYLLGVWLGSHLFGKSGENQYRQIALVTLVVLSCLALLK